ncbi:MAG: DUF3078 domain-containing protein [Bacteroidota bacterium]
MRAGLVILLLIIAGVKLRAQDTTVVFVITDTLAADTSPWKLTGLSTFNFSQVSLNNWNGGGQSAISGTSLVNAKLTYTGKKTLFENTLNAAFGLQRLQKQGTVKTDDKLEFLTTYGREAFGKWYYTVSGSFRSQFAPGYNYPNDSTVISRFLAPGYVTFGLGLENKIRDCFTIFISPISAKYTIVQDDSLSAQGAFGVDPGKRLREEYGGSARIIFSCPLIENVNFATQMDLFSNYSKNPENVDVNWTTLISFKVNRFITTSISTSLVYDDDVIIKQDKNDDGILDVEGPRTQFKEVFNFGLQYKF